MGKAWDKLDWTMQGSFAGGGSDRFKSSPPLPSYGGSSENRICRTCKGSERGNDRVGFKRCRCEDPKFPERKLSTNAIGLKIQDSHRLWLAQVYRVLRPGGSIKVFAATRTQHRLTAAIEAVGFVDIGVEAWVYGSGFPKSMDVSKAIDKRPGAVGHYLEIKKFLSDAIQKSIKTRSQIDAECGFSACDFARTTGSSPFTNVIPDARKWGIMKGVLCFDSRWDDAVEAAERAVVGTGTSGATAMWNLDGGMGRFDVTAPASEAAQTWDGWGTALKPAWEPVIVAKKPLV